MLKKFIKISYVLSAGFIGLLMLLYLLFNTFTFQNYLVKRLTTYVNKTFHTRIEIGEISYDGWTYFSLRRVNFGDQRNDTTFYAGRLQFSLIGMHLDSTKFILNDVVLDDGLCKITTYKDGTYSLDVINLFSDPNDTTVSDPNAPPFHLELRNLECMDTRFMYVDSTGKFFPEGFDYNRMHFYETNFRSKCFSLYDDSMVFDVKNFSTKERSGFEILRMKALAIISPSIIELRNLDMVTPNSHLKDYFSMNSHSWEDYADFLNKVVLKANLKNSHVDMKDIVYFVPEFKNYKYAATVSGSAKGPISNLRIKDFLASVGEETRAKGDLTFRGLPNIEETFMDLRLDYFSTNKKELETIIDVELPSELADLGKITYKGNYTGFYKDFVSYGSFETAFGSAQTDLNMKLNESTMLSEYSGNIEMNSFQLGSFLSNKSLGVLDFRAHVNGKGFDLNTIDAKFETQINSIEYNQYVYHDLNLKGNIIHKNLHANLDVNDTNLVMQSSLALDLSNSFKHFVLDGAIENVNLKALNFSDQKISLGAIFKANYYFKDLNDQYGELAIDDFHYEKYGYSYRINQIRIEAQNDEEESITLYSDFAKGKIKGEFDFTTLYDQLKYWTLGLANNYFETVKPKFSKQKFSLELDILNTANISPLLFPGFNASNVDLEGFVNTENESYELAGYIGNINYEGTIMNQTTFKITEDSRTSASLILGFKTLGKVDSLWVGDFALKADAKENIWDLHYQIMDSSSLVQGVFNHEILFEPNALFLNFEPSWIQAGNSRWQILAGKKIELNDKSINFNGFKIENGKQEILLDGFYDYNGKQKNISAKLENLELNTYNEFFSESNVAFGGLANGFLVYKNMGSRDVVIAQIKTTDLSLDYDTLGDYSLNISYRENEDDLLIDFTSLKGKINQLRGAGKYQISNKNLDLNIDFKDSKVPAFQAFVKDYVKLYNGDARLNAKLSGPIDQLKMNGQLQINQVDFKVDYLQTNYHLEKALVNFDDELIKILPFNIEDENKNTARVNGKIMHKGFSSLKYDINIDQFSSFQVLKTTVKDNELFYGNVYATGDFKMKGTDNNLALYIDVKSEKGTKIMVNPFGASTETGESYIHFVSRDTLFSYSGKSARPTFGIGVYMNIKANTNAEIQVIFDAKSDDRIKAKGVGNLKMNYLPNGNFTMDGDYELTEGEYRFSALNVVAKKFDLKPGSRIKWSGDPLTGLLNIKGVYALKTSINEIVNMSNSPDPNVRVPVECIINIGGIVEKPEFVFDLNFPDLQNNVTGAAASELNAVVANFRREPEMMNQQMLFLLISGSFVPINNSNNSAASTIGSQTVSDLLSKQAASLIGKAVPNIDLSVDLLNASDPTKGRTVLLSASKRFLDNRLEVQTSYAIDQTQTNFSATYNLKKNGNTKLKFFNKSGFDALYNRNVITSGTGLFYRKEFDHLNELFKKQKKSFQ
ncbi:MAG: translocation/assembly module TamB domain-containing protein [bacterium]|nr:translocation/assembly module TamB domain-containing protein [bacterium]